jgi:hypothetical protein
MHRLTDHVNQDGNVFGFALESVVLGVAARTTSAPVHLEDREMLFPAWEDESRCGAVICGGAMDDEQGRSSTTAPPERTGGAVGGNNGVAGPGRLERRDRGRVVWYGEKHQRKVNFNPRPCTFMDP